MPLPEATGLQRAERTQQESGERLRLLWWRMESCGWQPTVVHEDPPNAILKKDLEPELVRFSEQPIRSDFQPSGHG